MLVIVEASFVTTCCMPTEHIICVKGDGAPRRNHTTEFTKQYFSLSLQFSLNSLLNPLYFFLYLSISAEASLKLIVIV